MSDLSLELSDSDIANRMSDALCLNPYYEKQVEETFEFFRMGSPNVWFKTDVKDLLYDLINNLNLLIENCKTRKEKYVRLNKPFVKAIDLTFEKYKPKILATKERNRKESEQAFTDLPLSISDHWLLVNVDQISLPDALAELIEYTPPSQESLSSILFSKDEKEEEEVIEQSNYDFIEEEEAIKPVDSTPVTSQDIKFVLETISKQAPYD